MKKPPPPPPIDQPRYGGKWPTQKEMDRGNKISNIVGNICLGIAIIILVTDLIVLWFNQ